MVYSLAWPGSYSSGRQYPGSRRRESVAVQSSGSSPESSMPPVEQAEVHIAEAQVVEKIGIIGTLAEAFSA